MAVSISFKQLQVFVATAHTKLVSLAAERCFITQSAASMALTQLENLMHTKLFERVGKRLVLNDLGQHLLPKAESILQQVLEFEMQSHAKKLVGNLTIGASRTIGTYFLPTLITQFLSTHPEVKVDYSIENTDITVQKILNAEMSIGFIESDYFDQKLESLMVKRDQLLIVADKNHPLAKKPFVTERDLQDYPWLLREKGSGTRKIFENNAKNFFNKLDILVELNEPEAIKKMLVGSLNLSCLSQEIIQEAVDKGQLIPLKIAGLELMRNFTMIYLKNRYQTMLLKAFIEFITSQANSSYLPTK